jgi:glycosyltransferase involved in cell wall biosynthesis
MPRVSVLLPFRDVEATIDEAVASVLEEREIAIELIAIDDFSADRSAEIVRARARRDPRIVLVKGEGRGIARALSVGLEHARGPWIARMDGDDVSLPGRFRRQLAALERDPRLAAIGTRIEAFPETEIAGGLARYVAWQNALITPEEHARDLFVEAPLCHPSVMFRRDALERVGGWRDRDWPEDYDLWLRLDAAGLAIAKVPEVLLRWRQRAGRATFADPRYALERHRALKAAFLAPLLRAETRALVCWGAGPTGRRLARALEQEGIRFARFVDIDPRKIGGRARGAPIAHPRELDRARDVVIVAVGAAGARDLIRADLAQRGFVERRDSYCAA